MRTSKLVWVLSILVLLLAGLIAAFYPQPSVQDSSLVYAYDSGSKVESNISLYNCHDVPQPELQNVSQFRGEQNQKGAVFMTEVDTGFRLCIPGNEIYVADLVISPKRDLRTGGEGPTHVQIHFLTPEEFPEDREVIARYVFPLGVGGEFEFVVKNQKGQSWLIFGEMTEYDDDRPEQGFTTIRLRFSASLQVQMVN